jgi:hypothetical protein
LQRLSFQLLDHLYPGHPDFDPNVRGQELKATELETVVRAVEAAVAGQGRSLRGSAG